MPPILRTCIALAVATLMAGRGLKKKSLSKSGAVAAFVVGFLSFFASYRMGLTLILFYQSSSSLTKVRGQMPHPPCQQSPPLPSRRRRQWAARPLTYHHH